MAPMPAGVRCDRSTDLAASVSKRGQRQNRKIEPGHPQVKRSLAGKSVEILDIVGEQPVYAASYLRRFLFAGAVFLGGLLLSDSSDTPSALLTLIKVPSNLASRKPSNSSV